MRKHHFLLLQVLIACFSMQVSAQVNLQQGLVAYYPFNGNANDESGIMNHGTVYGATLSTDRFNNQNSAYSFDGLDDFINVEHSPSLCPESSVTVSAWVNPANISDWHQILTKRFSEYEDPFNSYILDSSPTDHVWSFYVSNGIIGSQTGILNTKVILSNTWTFIVGTYNGQEMKLFINGFEVCRTIKTGNIGYSNLSLRIGQAIPMGGQQNFYGKIDDIRIYNRALNDQEIYALYTEGQPPQTNTISSILINQRNDGSGIVDVYFNLYGSGSQYSIALAASFDNGNTFTTIPVSFLSGDVSNIIPGTNKHIVWDGLGSHPNTYSTGTKLKIIAN